jgi:hypothetical protein
VRNKEEAFASSIAGEEEEEEEEEIANKSAVVRS